MIIICFESNVVDFSRCFHSSSVGFDFVFAGLRLRHRLGFDCPEPHCPNTATVTALPLPLAVCPLCIKTGIVCLVIVSQTQQRQSEQVCGDKVNRFAVLSGGDKVREETCVIGDSIVRLVDDVVCRKGPPKCVRICLPGAGIQDVRNRVASVVGPGKGGAVLVHVGTNDVDKKGSEEVMGRYRELVRELKRVRVGQIVLSGILPVRGGYTRNNRRISINLRLQALCQAEGVGFLNMWEHFEQGDGLFSKDGLHLNKRGAAVLGKGFLRALGDGIGQLSLN